jgi:Ca-activated chloride channel homolog
MNFRHPWFFVLIPIVFLLSYLFQHRKRYFGLRFSSIGLFSGTRESMRTVFERNLVYLRAIALIFIVLALARPQSPVEDSIRRGDAVDIILTIDVSESMLAEDFGTDDIKKNRIDAVKDVIPDFIDSRKNDRIGIIIFATRPFIAAPLTFNHSWLLDRVEDIGIGIIDGRRTAIGSAIATSLNRLRDSEAKSKVMVLLTDGRNNAGDITPEAAARIARALDIKVYTIGIGRSGSSPFPILDKAGDIIGYDSIKMDLDEDLLRKIALDTGGRYFRVTDIASLGKVYRDIDNMEKILLEEDAYDEYNELFGRFLLAGILILLFEIILSGLFLRRIP